MLSFVKGIPVANLLLSAAILFSGSTPGKLLLLLKHLNMASIKERTCLIIEMISAPAILYVRNEKQSTLPSECVSKDPSQLAVMVEQIAQDILPHMESL